MLGAHDRAALVAVGRAEDPSVHGGRGTTLAVLLQAVGNEPIGVSGVPEAWQVRPIVRVASPWKRNCVVWFGSP